MPTRPWIDPSVLKARYYQLAASCHPDSPGATTNLSAQDAAVSSNGQSPPAPSGPPAQDTLSHLNAARQILEDPVSRILCLLEKEAPEELAALSRAHPSLDLSQHFLEVATILREVESFCEQQASTRSQLTRALLRAEHSALRHDVDRSLARLDELWHQCEAQLQAADAVWERRTPLILHQLATVQREMAFLQKWRSQLREARLRLSS